MFYYIHQQEVLFFLLSQIIAGQFCFAILLIVLF